MSKDPRGGAQRGRKKMKGGWHQTGFTMPVDFMSESDALMEAEGYKVFAKWFQKVVLAQYLAQNEVPKYVMGHGLDKTLVYASYDGRMKRRLEARARKDNILRKGKPVYGRMCRLALVWYVRKQAALAQALAAADASEYPKEATA